MEITFGYLVQSPAGIGTVSGFKDNKFIVNGKLFPAKKLKPINGEKFIVLDEKVVYNLIHKNLDLIKNNLSGYSIFKGDRKSCVKFCNENKGTYLADNVGNVLLDSFDGKVWK